MASEHARRWVGVDVGGPQKGFDVAVLDDRDRVRLHRTRDVDEVVAMATGARLLGIDAPAAWAPDERSRPDERAFAAAGVCGIRFTPDEVTAGARTDDHLGWVWQGLALGAAITRAGVDTVEVFPTAAWTRWLGPRGDDTRLVWAREGLARLRADGLDDDAGATPSQDAMDAIAAALVTRQADRGDVDRFGTLTVPAAGRWPLTTSIRR